jgi:Alpha/beta hydrolase domain
MLTSPGLSKAGQKTIAREGCMKRLIGSAAVVLMATTAAVQARVTRIEISRQEPFATGQSFGDTGAYEKVVGRFHGELDPTHPHNAGIVDLDKAPRNARGMVEYSSDLYILKPANLAKGNGALLYDVNNRGNKRALAQFNSAPGNNDPTTAEHAGNGFLMRQGFTVVWSGWIPGMSANNNALRIEVPTATAATGPIEQTVWDEFLANDSKTVAGRLSYRATTTDKSQATLVVRDRNSEAPSVVPADQWEYVDARSIRLLPAGTPFRIGAIYQFIYKAANPPVNGIGFAATRDLVAFLRYAATDDAGTANPLSEGGRAAISRTLAHGTSQSGRYLRDFVYSGFNEDELNRIVFDGVNPHVATARTYLNYRFGQPNRIIQTGHGFMYFPGSGFPFAYETQVDPFTGTRDGVLARCAARGTCPKLVHTNSATEYWQTAQSLVTTDPLGQRDGTPPANVRIYHVAGTHHTGVGSSMPEGVCVMPPDRVDYRPALRAALTALDRWVKDGTPPPPSRYPRIDDGTLVATTKPAGTIPGFTLAKGPNPRVRIDYGPDFDRGIIGKALPVELEDSYRVLVPKVDADGNEVAGLRLPDITVPTGTATGWNVRAPTAGGAGELCYLQGSFVPFAKNKAEREASNDSRPSLAERYRDAADYAEKVRQAADALAREGYLLQEDVKRMVERASARTW